jgi:hypothetical protein
MVQCKGVCKDLARCKKSGTHDNYCHHHRLIDCSVCFESVPQKNTVLLECGHSFCKKCINTWIIEKSLDSSCPMCRHPVDKNKINDSFIWGIKNGLLGTIDVTVYNVDFLDEFEKLYMTFFTSDDAFKLLNQVEFDIVVDSLPHTIVSKLDQRKTLKKMYIKNNQKISEKYYMILF